MPNAVARVPASATTSTCTSAGRLIASAATRGSLTSATPSVQITPVLTVRPLTDDVKKKWQKEDEEANKGWVYYPEGNRSVNYPDGSVKWTREGPPPGSPFYTGPRPNRPPHRSGPKLSHRASLYSLLITTILFVSLVVLGTDYQFYLAQSQIGTTLPVYALGFAVIFIGVYLPTRWVFGRLRDHWNWDI